MTFYLVLAVGDVALPALGVAHVLEQSANLLEGRFFEIDLLPIAEMELVKHLLEVGRLDR